MISKRKLKKEIDGICTILFAECASKMLLCENADKENIEAIISSIMAINDNYIRRISHPEPGMKPKEYFKDLIDSFNKEIGEIIDNIESIN